MANVTLAVTGSIAAYKAADLVSLLNKQNHNVTVLMTKAATQFITPLTLQVLSKNKVHIDIMDEEHPSVVNHIDIAKHSDIFIVAPTTADTLSRLSQGAASDIVTSVALALPPGKLKFIAPAMNTNMYTNPLTTKNIDILKSVGYNVIYPKKSLLACGDFGEGALAEIETIARTIDQATKIKEI